MGGGPAGMLGPKPTHHNAALRQHILQRTRTMMDPSGSQGGPLYGGPGGMPGQAQAGAMGHPGMGQPQGEGQVYNLSHKQQRAFSFMTHRQDGTHFVSQFPAIYYESLSILFD